MDRLSADDIGLPWELLDRYFSGTSAAGEVARVEAWIGGDAARRGEIETLRGLWARGAAAAGDGLVWDTKGAVAALQRRVRADIVGTRVGRPYAPARHRWTGIGGIVAAVVLAMVLGGVWRHRVGIAGGGRVYVAAPGQRMTATLADGTRLTLAPGSRARLVGIREIDLDGEGYFAVVHDSLHPFEVHAHGVVTRDVGTEFDIRAYAEDSAVQVAVVVGAASVRPARWPEATTLRVGDMAMVGGRITNVMRGVDVSTLTAWTTGHLAFDETPVREVFATVGRWYDLGLHTADTTLLARHITATFTNAPADQVLTSLAATFDARVARQGRQVTFVSLHTPAGK